ncbi:MAG: hypothetical protein V4459_15505 [Pseudomonadota bacterium]
MPHLLRHLPRAALAAAALLALSPPSSGQTPPRVGGDRDAHGCIPSAGYSWSQVRHSCVRPFAVGIRLDPVKKNSLTLSAFLLFRADDDTKVAELFLPGRRGTVLLKEVPSSGAGKWRNREFRLSQWKGMYMLDTARGRALYQGSSAP